MELLDALDLASGEFGGRLMHVSDAAWALPTPCEEWDVRYLAAHVVGGNRFAVSILAGLPSTEAIELVMSAPQLGGDAVSSWSTSAAEQRSAFHADGVLDRTVDHPLGLLPARHFLEFRILDLTLHAWDLAQALGLDDVLDADLVDTVLAIIDRGPPGMGFGLRPLGQAGDRAPAQTRLLDHTGRPTRWRPPRTAS